MKRYERKNLEVERKNQRSHSKGKQSAMGSRTNHLKKRENPLKKELNNPQGLDFANKAGSLMAQPSTIELLPPKDMMNESTRPEQTTSGVKSESVRVLRTKVSITYLALQGWKSFTFEYEGTTQNPRFYKAKVKFSLKLVIAPNLATIRGTGYQQVRITNATNDANIDLHYGPIIVPNWIGDFFTEKAVIEVLGGTEIEPATQTHQITKLIDFHTKVKPEDAAFKYTNLGGYTEDYNAKTANQRYQVPVTIGNNGAITQTAGANYKQMTLAEFTEGSTGSADAGFRYTTKDAAELAAKFHLGAEVHFEVPLRRLCRVAKCKQMFPSGKKYFITLYKIKESFLFACQDSAARQNVIFQLTDCTIEVPIVEPQPEKQEEERKKIASDEGICYSLTNSYIRTYYIYLTDKVNCNPNVMNGYKPKYLFLYWVDYTHKSDGDININNYILERLNLCSLNVSVDDHLVKSYEPKKGQTSINWDQIYQDFIE